MPSVFDRLYNTETAASAGKRVGHHAPPSPPPHSTKRAPDLKSAGGHHPQSNQNHSPASKSSDTSTEEGACSAPSAASAAAASTTKCRLLCSSQYHPDAGFHELSISSLHLVSDLYRFENGELNQRELATCITDALWNRDFRNGAHWDIDSASVSERPIRIEGENDDDEHMWEVSKSATWDWKDIYSVAESKGTIRYRMDAGEIRIENYSYYVAGWNNKLSGVCFCFCTSRKNAFGDT